ncbi:MAG: 5'/3'-nucleotidase SurE [Acidimicrobiales bacterium]
MRLLVTNDDGIDSIGLHVLVRELAPLGEVIVAAPDQECSGSGAAFGPLHIMRPEIQRARVAGASEAWTVNGPPGLCVILARLGVYGPIDLVVAGINPGANVGRSVYHSGTVGAALTARNGGISGVAVSQAVVGFGVEGQGWDDALANQLWDSAAVIGAAAVKALLDSLPADPVVLNLNVPNLPLNEIKGWRETEVGHLPPRSVATARLEERLGHEGRYRVHMDWGKPMALPPHLDGGAVEDGYVSVSWLSRLVHESDGGPQGVGMCLDGLLGR